MKTRHTSSGCYEFHFPHLDTSIQVIACADNVTIRATRATFCAMRKEYFIRQLAREGFIAEEYQWNPLNKAGVRWLVDASWVAARDGADDEPRSGWMTGLFYSAGALWVISMALLFCHVR